MKERRVLDPSAYFDPSWFQRELDAVFSNAWLFACTADEVAEDDAWVTVAYGRRSVVVQRFRSGLRAFENVCAHRHARLRAEPCGRGRLACPYHGLSYGAEGTARGFATLGKEKGVRNEFRLAAFAVEELGNLVFVYFGESPGDLRAQLGPEVVETIENLSRSSGRHIGTLRMPVAANWKISVENTLESVHVGVVHRTSLGTLMEPGRSAHHAFFGQSSLCVSELKEATGSLARLEKLMAADRWRPDGYHHVLAFPNLLLLSTAGRYYGVEAYFPRDAQSSECVHRAYLPRMGAELSKMQGTMMDAFAREALASTETVLREDNEVRAAVQLGCMQASRSQVLVGGEERIAHFQNALRDAIEPA